MILMRELFVTFTSFVPVNDLASKFELNMLHYFLILDHSTDSKDLLKYFDKVFAWEGKNDNSKCKSLFTFVRASFNIKCHDYTI